MEMTMAMVLETRQEHRGGGGSKGGRGETYVATFTVTVNLCANMVLSARSIAYAR